ncbi:hypothetical protein SAMN02745206_03648 [Desulfacinum infernum DSM 9756]|uniref:Uncharacterized protein n=1 Tax=Desulfacinum infernum DSM 9756 TaxID=1121391 RepID=A0A1M5IPZ0_9BACT|nr:hypothetical protein SAMN02745206_03648 [Desulfacinum infernum DSM 9756]
MGPILGQAPRSLSENKFPPSTDKGPLFFRSRGASAPRGTSSSARYSQKENALHGLGFSSANSPGEARHPAWVNEPAPRRCPLCGSAARRDEPGAAAPPHNGRPPVSRLSPLPHTPSLPHARPEAFCWDAKLGLFSDRLLGSREEAHRRFPPSSFHASRSESLRRPRGMFRQALPALFPPPQIIRRFSFPFRRGNGDRCTGRSPGRGLRGPAGPVPCVPPSLPPGCGEAPDPARSPGGAGRRRAPPAPERP